MSTFKDNFSAQADVYARFRPQYPEALYHFLSGLTQEHELAWDCGTGNGQAALHLAEHYQSVVATDPSAQQISHCFSHERITYRVEKAERSSLASGSVDLLTIANALHWFDHAVFYAEARRVLKPGGVLAAWSYALPFVSPAVDEVITHLHDEVLAGCWLPENKIVADGYRDLPFPFAQLETPEFMLEKNFTAEDMIGYLSTWSATQRYLSTKQQDPVALIADALKAAWGAESRTVSWKLFLKTARL